ncbi:MAG: hypothetical protein Q4P66_10090, partial [Actinomycetaceae bacterium]|nr:hypothetical protein [Actinomycetaceae bacterium]
MLKFMIFSFPRFHNDTRRTLLFLVLSLILLYFELDLAFKSNASGLKISFVFLLVGALTFVGRYPYVGGWIFACIFSSGLLFFNGDFTGIFLLGIYVIAVYWLYHSLFASVAILLLFTHSAHAIFEKDLQTELLSLLVTLPLVLLIGLILRSLKKQNATLVKEEEKSRHALETIQDQL